MMKSYAVIGLGRFGAKIATSLYEYGMDVIAIDINEEYVNAIADSVTRAVTADAKNKNELKRLGIAECDCVIVALGSDLASLVLVTMNVKSLGVDYIICKAHDDMHREILEKLGANKVIIPERDVAEKTARSLASPNFLEYVELSNEYGIIEVLPPKPWIGKTIRELNVRARYHINIIAAKKKDKVIVSMPADFEIAADTKLVLLGDYDALDQIRRIK